MSAVTPTVTIDDALYGRVADSFVQKFVTSVVSILVDNGVVDPHADDQDAADLIYSLCFFALAQFEDHSGFDAAGARYVAHCAFAEHPVDPDVLVFSRQRTFLHGELDDRHIVAALEAVREKERRRRQ